MKKTLIGFTLLMLIITACTPGPQPTEQPMYPNDESYPNENSYPSDSPTDLTPAQQAAIAALSESLNLPADQITLISTEAVTWRDGCLGVVKIGVMCTQAEVPGFKIILEADGKQYEFHTNHDGSSVIEAVLSTTSTLVEDEVKEQLAENLGIDKDQISVVSDAAIEFPDACLGVAMPDVMCAQVVTPGHILVLEANGIQYEYHTDENGSRVQPATFALTWKREGGIAGFCDSLTVFLSGEVYGNQCKATDGRMETFASLLSASERKRFDAWVTQYSQITLDASDPEGVSDRMIVMLNLFGRGTGKPGKAEEKMMLNWVQGLFQKLYS